MKTIKQWIFLCFMTLAFWGVLYPQFSLMEETYEYVSDVKDCGIISENSEQNEIREKGGEWKKNPKKDFIAILNAESGELQFRSRLWELWKEKAEKKKKNGAENSLWMKKI